MVTDWLHNPDTMLIMPLIVALICTVVLASTRRILPPSQPRARLIRAFFIITVVAAGNHLAARLAPGEFMATLLTLAGDLRGRGTILLLATGLGSGVLLGWLILVWVEGRSLRDMGWVRRRWVVCLLAGAAAGILLNILVPGLRLADRLLSDLGSPRQGNLAAVAALPGSVILLFVAYGLLIGWFEENLFRGHLMITLTENGLSGRRANMLQALFFALSHSAIVSLPALSASRVPTSVAVGAGIASAIVFWLWGLVFGVLRLRTRSIVAGFALHTLYDAGRFVIVYGPMVLMLQGIAGLGK